MHPRQPVLFPPFRPLTERFGRDFFRTVPETPGVYLFCGPRDGVLYVGKARNLRRRLGSYRSADPTRLPRKLQRLLAAVERIHWDECASEAAALDRERALIRTLRPRFNTIGVRPPVRTVLEWCATEAGLGFRWGAAARGWAFATEPLAGVRHWAPALLRLVWRLAHPQAAWSGLPPGWNRAVLPAEGRLATNGPAAGAAELAEQLALFFTCPAPELPALWLTLLQPQPGFETAWAADDAATLARWAARHLGRSRLAG